MDKKTLLSALQRCMDTGDSVDLVYAQHIESTLFLSDIAPNRQAHIRDFLGELRSRSEGRIKTYESLMRRIKESAQNVY